MDALIRIMCLLFAHNSVTSAPVYLEMVPPTIEEIAFMKQYGYLSVGEDVDGSSAYTPQSLAGAVAKLQAFAGLPPTGDLDDETRSLFKKRRCGIKDIETPSASMRKRRYILQQGWRKRDISYRINNGSSSLGKSRIEELMATALQVWAPHGGLRFTKTDTGDADIQVSFASQDHGDGFPFDGPGHVVAHAFGPPYGEMHFDDDEHWTEEPDDADEDATEFFAVAVHEIGHALGLCHSNVKTSVMYPYYQVPVERLNSDDILGMQELYLKEQLPEPQSTEAPAASVPRFTKPDSGELDEDDVPDLCYANYDTIQVLQGMIYVFEEEWVWVLSARREVAPGYPRRFHDVFRGLPEEVRVIRTIYEKRNGNIAVFQGDAYWEFDPTFRLVQRGSIADYQLPEYVPELQTVFVSDYNNKTYLVEYERFWRYDEAAAAMDPGYPKEMAAWRKLPYPVDAALVWQGDTYFFRGPRFWRFDNARIEAHAYYPLPTAQVWFPCGASRDMDAYVANERP